jgi:hypothetical protein
MFAGSDKNSGGDVYFSTVGEGQADADYERLNQQIPLGLSVPSGRANSPLMPRSVSKH